MLRILDGVRFCNRQQFVTFARAVEALRPRSSAARRTGVKMEGMYNEGILLKRQRGLRASDAQRRNLKFQKRFCRLTRLSLDYYDKKTLKGQFAVEQIRIVEVANPKGFRRDYCFQVGDSAEVMYFAATSDRNREEWMEAFRKAALDNGNKMLSHYHTGVYGLLHKNRWSCCGFQRMAPGCCPTSNPNGSNTPHRTKSLYARAKNNTSPDPTLQRQSLPDELWLCQSQPVSYCWWSPEASSDGSEDKSFVAQKSSRSMSDSLNRKRWIEDPGAAKCNTIPKRHEEPRLQQIVEEKVCDLSSHQWPSQLSVATAISVDSGYKGSSATVSRRSSQSTIVMESTLPHDSKSVQSFTSDLGIVRDAGSLNSLNSSVSQMKLGETIEVDWDSRSEKLPQSHMDAASMASQHTEEGLLYLDSEEEIDLSSELAMEELTLASTPLSPLFCALVNDHYLDLKTLLEKGGNPNELEPATNASLLHWAAEKGCTDAVRLLIKFMADINIKDEGGTTPLMRACRKDHFDIVEILLNHGAKVNAEAANGRTPLHEASVVGDSEMVELLIHKGADVLSRDNGGFTSYELAFRRGHKDVMEVLLQFIPPFAHPYDLLGSTSLSSSQTITTLAFHDSQLISGAKDCHVSVWNTTDLTVSEDIQLSNTVLAVDVWSHYLVIGSTTVKMIDSRSKESHVLDGKSDSLHLVAFGFKGHLATASVESNIAKLWVPVQAQEKDETQWKYEASITVGTNPSCICSLSVSPNVSQQWLAVGVQPGSKFNPAGSKVVHLFDWSTRRPLHQLDTSHGGLAVDVYTVFSPDGREVAVGCADNLGVWEAETGALIQDYSMIITSPDAQLAAHVSSLCFSPDETHLAAGLSTGEVQVFERYSGNSLFNINRPESPSPVTSIAYSPSGKLFAAGYQNGVLQLSKAYGGERPNSHEQTSSQNSQSYKPHFLDQVKLHNKPLLTRTRELKFDSNGGEYHSPDDGYSLTVPKGAIPERLGLVSIQCGVIPYGPLGPFDYPEGVKPVSPIVWFCSNPSITFEKPVAITIPHCLDCKSEEHSKSLAFFKANHDDYTVNCNGQRIFHFKKAEGVASFSPNTSSGTLHAEHFCFYCVGVYSREDTAQANFCLITAKPLQIQRRCRIHFCLTYFLATCLKAVEEQLADDYDLTVKKRMKFQILTRGADSAITIKFERFLPGGWSIKRESMGKEIFAREVYFWDNLPHELELMHDQKMYPPRFTLQVCGDKATHDATALVEFEGACEDLSTEIHLGLPTTEVLPYDHTSHSQLQILEQGMDSRSFQAYSAGVMVDGPFMQANFTEPRYPYRNGHSLDIVHSASNWEETVPSMLQSLPQCFPYMYPNFQQSQTFQDSFHSHLYEPPSDIDLEEVTKEVMGKLRDDWVKLQSYLGIPDDVMYELEHEGSERNKIRALLKQWRNMCNGNRAQLAECLQNADQRLHGAVKLLMSETSNGHMNGSRNGY